MFFFFTKPPQIYPDGDHSLLHEQYHLYKTMEDHFAKCFNLVNADEDIIELPITRVIKGGKQRIITDD